MTKGWNFAPLYSALDGIQQQRNVEDNRAMQYERLAEDDYRWSEQQRLQQEQMRQAQVNQNAMLKHRDKVFDANQAHRNRMFGLEQQKLAQSAKPGPTSFGKTGAIFQGQDGRFYSVQFGSDGSRNILPFDTGISPARGVQTVDEGTGTRVINKATGQDVRRINKDIAGAEREKKLGQARGALEANKTKATSSYWAARDQNQSVLDSIDQALGSVRWGTVGWRGAIGQYIPGTDAHKLQQQLLTVRSNIGFDKLQDMRDNSPTGGALGQVSEMELKTLQAVWGSVEQSQGESEIRRNLRKFKTLYRRTFQRARERYKRNYGQYPEELDVPGQAPSSAPAASGGFSIRRID